MVLPHWTRPVVKFCVVWVLWKWSLYFKLHTENLYVKTQRLVFYIFLCNYSFLAFEIFFLNHCIFYPTTMSIWCYGTDLWHAVGWRLVDVQHSPEFHWGDRCLCHLGSQTKRRFDGRNPAFSSWYFHKFSHDLPGFIHPRWYRISSINSMKVLGVSFELPILRQDSLMFCVYDSRPHHYLMVFLVGIDSQWLWFSRKLGVSQLVVSKSSASLVVYWPSFVEHLGTARFFIVHNCHMTSQTRYGDDMRSRSHPCFTCHGPWTVFKTTKPS